MTNTPTNLQEPLKKCNACGKRKPKSEYYHWHGTCKECDRVASMYNNIRHYMERRRYFRDRRQTPAGKATQIMARKLAHIRTPEKDLARSRLRYAVKTGKISKPEICEQRDCLNSKIEGHHYLGYDKEHWFDVMWLCRKHHLDAHKFTYESRGLV
jgi:hypothetical protein